eukprot:INCI12786.2.p1 GENE.INCI12786.2~~INCI12786.2.p1  ORF type:complete len:291 (+),score=36.88 INCI12786.2:97-969(+)
MSLAFGSIPTRELLRQQKKHGNCGNLSGYRSIRPSYQMFSLERQGIVFMAVWLAVLDRYLALQDFRMYVESEDFGLDGDSAVAQPESPAVSLSTTSASTCTRSPAFRQPARPNVVDTQKVRHEPHATNNKRFPIPLDPLLGEDPLLGDGRSRNRSGRRKGHAVASSRCSSSANPSGSRPPTSGSSRTALGKRRRSDMTNSQNGMAHPVSHEQAHRQHPENSRHTALKSAELSFAEDDIIDLTGAVSNEKRRGDQHDRQVRKAVAAERPRYTLDSSSDDGDGGLTSDDESL